MFIHDDFLLTNETAKRLFHSYAKNQPIVDYHCHLDPKLIATNYRFESITELWLDGDHYKWRAMRAHGIPEYLITGDGSDWEKFEAWAETVESLVGNALYHWTHLELKEYFNETRLLSKKTAKEIYEACNRYLNEHEVTTQSLIEQSDVRFIGTTDDILSDLSEHQKIRESTNLFVSPSFRPDPILTVNQGFQDYLVRCQDLATEELSSYDAFVRFLKQRVIFFNENGCKSADHGFQSFLYEPATQEEIERIFQKACTGETLTSKEQEKWQGNVLVDLGKTYANYGWVMQLHFGAIRNNNTRLFEQVGADNGTDSVFDQSHIARPLNAFLNCLDQTNELPKTILYNLNPSQNDVVASICGNFQSNDKGIRSKVQFGAVWWFGDTYTGMRNQLETLSNYGILMNFIGMLTDSRSFISYPRHEYFRRIFCQFVGQKVESGFYPDSEELLEKLVNNVSYGNVVHYFGLNDY